MKISIIGVGRLGGALAIALAKKNYTIENLVTRKRESSKNAEKIAEFINPKPEILLSDEFCEIKSDTVFICTQDFEIEAVAASLAENLQTKPNVFHTSGSLSSEILHKLKADGFAVGSIHPLVSISDSTLGAERFAGAYFCLEGSREAVKIAEKIVADLEGKSFSVETRYKTLYHASAVTASGHLTALVDTAIEMLAKCGLEKTDAQKILLPLVKSAVENLQTQTPSEALTGTFARADVAGFENHVRILRENVSGEVLELYLQLATRSLHLAEMQGTNREKIADIRKKISLAKKNLK